MNAVATKPRAKTARAKPAARASAVYVPSTEPSLRARLDTLQAALSQVEEHIESAFDAADDGSPAELLLDHLGHALLADAMRPMMSDKPTRADAKQTYGDLFLVTAALNGAMAMVAGTSIHPVLQEAFELLDWSQNECDSQALIDLLPEADLAADFARGRDHAIKMLDEAEHLQDEREGLRCYRKGGGQDNFFHGYLADVEEDPSLLPGFTSVLSAALRNDNMDLSELAKITLAEVQAGKPGANGTEVEDAPPPLAAAAPETDKPDPELLVNEAVALNNLTSWISGARDTLDTIRICAQINPVLKDQLRQSDVRYNSPEWLGTGADDGMTYLLMHQRLLIEALGRGAS